MFRHPEVQWMILLCAETYLIGSLVLRFRILANRRFSDAWNEILRTAFLALSTLGYLLYYHNAVQSTQGITLLGCAAVGDAAWMDVFRSNQVALNKKALGRFIATVVATLTVACFWKSERNPSFSYLTSTRWVGPWNNPNLYGLLIGVGAVLATGLLVSYANTSSGPNLQSRRWNNFKMALSLLAAFMMCLGLWKSYSRGAWLAACAGVFYLLIRSPRWIVYRWQVCICNFRFAVVFCAILALLFWQCQYDENVTARRVVSSSNQNDFSWRNRVAAWEGALQIMWESPWQGMGWNQPELLYGKYYSESRIDETAAFRMNDYFMLGSTLGIPALLCFLIFLLLSFAAPVRQEVCFTEYPMGHELGWLKTICLAGALVLAVGFWFDGGLFKLPTASVFWILLEIGRED